MYRESCRPVDPYTVYVELVLVDVVRSTKCAEHITQCKEKLRLGIFHSEKVSRLVNYNASICTPTSL